MIQFDSRICRVENHQLGEKLCCFCTCCYSLLGGRYDMWRWRFMYLCYLLFVSTIAFLSYIRSSIAYHIVGVCVYKEDPWSIFLKGFIDTDTIIQGMQWVYRCFLGLAITIKNKNVLPSLHHPGSWCNCVAAFGLVNCSWRYWNSHPLILLIPQELGAIRKCKWNPFLGAQSSVF